jgi:hypothetical protein
MNTTYMPSVFDVKYLLDFLIQIVLTNGKEGTIDLNPFIGQGLFEPFTN